MGDPLCSLSALCLPTLPAVGKRHAISAGAFNGWP
jgi:hypothetical protein